MPSSYKTPFLVEFKQCSHSCEHPLPFSTSPSSSRFPDLEMNRCMSIIWVSGSTEWELTLSDSQELLDQTAWDLEKAKFFTSTLEPGGAVELCPALQQSQGLPQWQCCNACHEHKTPMSPTKSRAGKIIVLLGHVRSSFKPEPLQTSGEGPRHSWNRDQGCSFPREQKTRSLYSWTGHWGHLRIKS